MRFLLFTILCSLFAIFIGCGGSKLPSDLPDLYPCTLTVLSEGKPLENALVELVEVPPQKYRAVTPTNAEGIAVMRTFNVPGVPVGKYKVLIFRDIDDNVIYKQNSDGTQGIASSVKFRTIDAKTYKAETTPFELDITGKEKNVTKTFDVGKAVKVKL